MLKRVFDVTIVLITIVFFFPVFLVISVLVAFKMGTPILFSQLRPGKDEKIFRMYKFRTMTEEVDSNGNYLPDEKRLNSFGLWLRSTSLDELPSLVNVLKGDMSLVGPRPLLVKYLKLYNAEQKRRHEVRPGLTGWAQINGRNLLSWDERFKMDTWYVENQSFVLDAKIIILTFKRVFKKEGITQDGNVTMSEFTGND